MKNLVSFMHYVTSTVALYFYDSYNKISFYFRSLDINEKINLYNELIENYEDMIVTETRNYKHCDNIKTLIKNTVTSLKYKINKDISVVDYVDYWLWNHRRKTIRFS